MKATLLLKEPKSRQKTHIYVAINYNCRKYKYSTGESIESDFWNPEKQEAKKGYRYQNELNARLRFKKLALTEALQALIHNGQQITQDVLKEKYESIINPTVTKPVITEKTFTEIVKDCITQSESGERLYSGYFLIVLAAKVFS